MSETRTEPLLVRFLLACYPPDYRNRYGAELLAVSRERAGGRRWPGLADVVDLLLGALRVRFARAGSTSFWRAGRPIVAVLGPVVLVAGLATDFHEVGWFVFYGGFNGLPWREAAAGAPMWLAWAGVAVFAALGWRRTAAVLAWLASAAMLIGLGTSTLPLILPTTDAWLVLAFLSTGALTFGVSNRPSIAVVGARSWWAVTGAVGLVLFARLLGHQFLSLDVGAWLLLAVLLVRACRPATASGMRAIALFSMPATLALLGAAVQYAPVGGLLFQVPAILVQGVVLVMTLLELGVFMVVLRRRERTRPDPA